MIEVERRRTAPGGSAPADADAIPSRSPRSGADPRRRLGRHTEARRFLSEHGDNGSVTPGVWDGLLNALRYHTIQDSLASLAAWERQVLHMAFVERRTNREIAAILSISRSTVRRRMVLALANLDDQLQRAATRASAVLLLLLAAAVAGARIAGRPLSALRATPAGNVILTTAAGAAAGVVIVGAIVSNQGAAAGNHGATRPLTHVTAAAPLPAPATGVPVSSIVDSAPSQLANSKTRVPIGTAVQPAGSLDPGCDGKPTNAPPTTPVRARGEHAGAPVTHPGPGGCGPHGVERP